MELINQSSLPAEVFVSPRNGAARQRMGLFVCKATFDTSGSGVALSDAPLPVFESEVETPLGLLPRDTHPYRTDRIEVVVLGAAYARGGATEATVTLVYGPHERQLRVCGDRDWAPTKDGSRVPGPPRPFERIPLSWTRAFGGSVDVQIDERTTVPLQHPINPHGTGFDARAKADELARGWGCPAGYPRVSGESPPPNIEPIRPTSSEGDPEPVCWATIPPGMSLVSDLVKQLSPDAEVTGARELVSEGSRRLGFAAHPDLCFAESPAGLRIRLEGLTREGTWNVRVPAMRIVVDALVSRRSQLEATPRLLVLLPEERRFTVTYSAYFRMEPDVEQERSLRVRAES